MIIEFDDIDEDDATDVPSTADIVTKINEAPSTELIDSIKQSAVDGLDASQVDTQISSLSTRPALGVPSSNLYSTRKLFESS